MTPDKPVRQLDFTQDMERQAIKVIAQDPGFVAYWVDRLQEIHFVFPWNVLIFKAIRNYHKKYSKLPSKNVIEQEVSQYLSPDDNSQGFCKYFEGLFDSPVEDEQYVKDALIDHMKKIDYEQFIFKYSTLCRDNQHSAIEPAFKEMIKRHVLTVQDNGYFEAKETLLERIVEEVTCSPAVPSPWPTYNANTNGGFHHGTLTGFMGPTGCHAKGQGIMMADGTIKPVEKIKVGDCLMGDSGYRTVLRLIRGKGKMYKVVPVKGSSFIVNDEHILTLIGNDKEYGDCGKITDIPVKDYIKKGKWWKHTHKLIRSSPVVFDRDKKPLLIEPYLLGVLLGDGSIKHSTPIICKSDIELHKYIPKKLYGFRETSIKIHQKST